MSEVLDSLPLRKHNARANPEQLVYTLIAEPKFGKTTWACSAEDVLLLAAERGHSFVDAYKIELDCWDYNMKAADKPQAYEDQDTGIFHMSFMQAVDAIIESPRFKMVAIDTTDVLAKMCVDYHLKKLGITHPGDWEYGKGHELAMNQPFRQAMGKIIKSGRGIIFITHSATTDTRYAGTTTSKKECTLPGGITKFVIPQSDVILHGKFGPKNPETGRRLRIWQTEGSDTVLAGGRMGNLVPPKFFIDPDQPWEQWKSFFTDLTATQRATDEYNAVMSGKKAEPSPAVEAPTKASKPSKVRAA